MTGRRVGTTELTISLLGFGSWSAGGSDWAFSGPPERDAESIAAMLQAFEQGVTWVDTSPNYGRGHSEELVAEALRRTRSPRPLVFTKCGRIWDAPESKPWSDLRPETIRAGCEASLRRLGVDTIDVLQIHWPDPENRVPVEESWGAMLRLVEEGMVRVAAVCNFDVALLERCERVGHVACLQTPMSLIVRDSAGALLEWCRKHATAVLVYSPMQVGLLTDSFRRRLVDEYGPGDWRRTHPEFNSPRLERNLALRDRLVPIARRHSTTVGAVAVAWTLAWPGVTAAIVGARTREQVQGWIQASSLVLTRADLDQIAAAIESTNAGHGPTAPDRT